MAPKKQTKRDLTNEELFSFHLALRKIRQKALKMSEKSIYNEKAKKELLRIEKLIWKITMYL